MKSFVLLLALLGVALCRDFKFINRCNQNIWVGAQGLPMPSEGGFLMGPGSERTWRVDDQLVSGRFWPRTNCNHVNGKLQCLTGQCYIPANRYVDDGTRCVADGGQPPYTIAEMTLQLPPNTDYYDLSLVDGYTIPMKMYPNGGTRLSNYDSKFNCGTSTCAGFNYARCPPELRLTDSNNNIIGCLSICSAINSIEQRNKYPYLRDMFSKTTRTGKPMVDLVCCSCGAGTGGCADPNSNYCCSPHNSDPNERGGKCFVEEWPRASDGQRYDEVFKNQCEEAYSWQFDDFQSTYQCIGAGYTMEFCPSGGSTPPPIPTPPTPTPPTPGPAPGACGPWIGGNGGGLKATFFRDINFASAVTTTIDPVISYYWGLGGPFGLTDNFSIRWTGFFQAPRTGRHTFYAESDDSSKIWINNNIVVDNGGAHGVVTRQGDIDLVGGVRYPIRIEYIEFGVEASIVIYYSVCDTPKSRIPASLMLAENRGQGSLTNAICRPFGSQGDGLTVTYFDGATTSSPVSSSLEKSIDVVFDTLPVNVTGETFTVRYTGAIQHMFSSDTTFHIESNGGVWTFQLDNGTTLFVNNNNEGPVSIDTMVDANAGAFHPLSFEFTGKVGSSLRLSWSNGCMEKKPVQSHQFFSAEHFNNIRPHQFGNSAVSFGIFAALLIALLF